jgi:hypothetical protein
MICKGLVRALALVGILAFPGFADAQESGIGKPGGLAPPGGAPPSGPGNVPPVGRGTISPGGAPTGGLVKVPPGGLGTVPPPGGVPRPGHFTSPGGSWESHPNWRGAGEFNHWRTGHWWRGTYGGRYGAWWVVGPDWYWYQTEVAPVPDPYTPPGLAPGYWYWCDAYQQYYPYVGSCPTPWRAISPR